MEFDKLSGISGILSKLSLGVPLSGDERQTIERWAGESPRNREFYDDACSGRILREKAAADAKYPSGKAGEAIGAVLDRRRRRRTIGWVSSSAAVIALTVVSFFFPRSADDRRQLAIFAPESPQAIVSVAGHTPLAIKKDEEGTAWREYAAEGKDARVDAGSIIRIDIPRGSNYMLRLDDGTAVWLNSESSIEYSAKFVGGNREVRLRGEAYFEVARNERMPFVVTAGGTKVVVLGTAFNVTAYESDNTVTATLASGLLDIVTPAERVRLVPGKQAVVSSGGIAVADVDADLYTSWVGGVFEFEAMELSQICARLARWYDVGFVFEGNSGSQKFTGAAWKNKPLVDFLDDIELVTNVAFSYKGGKVIVAPKR